MYRAKKQINQLTHEFRRLSDKKPNDVVNQFKLGLVNSILEFINQNLSGSLPIPNFERFDESEMPTNSDVLLVLSLYNEELLNKDFSEYGEEDYK